MAQIACGSCGLRVDATVTHAQSIPTYQVETTVGLEDFVRLCLFVKEQSRQVSGPNDCPYMKRTIEAAIADHRL
jgi:hypothetical protein